ncbi:Rieske (2Fe-2S) protein [Nitrospirillum iridis]|uniref:Nitrite reductase/ring-hydroxylating ferredoxin subunit n=1 Tax=Nitrospirillum iridis TaxID=765888 RepID=A0A7X0B0X9_9PROT|nr:nitrite reductase/ring-hydroxylating ferredoxin subunit [Nitrospirillum iridis]
MAPLSPTPGAQPPGEISAPGDARIRLCRADTLSPGQARGFDPAGSGRDTIFALRRGDTVLIYHNHCPHQGVPLEYRKDRFLSGDGQRILCYAHGAHFDADTGVCIEGPCRGQSLLALPCGVEDGWLWLNLPLSSPVLR